MASKRPAYHALHAQRCHAHVPLNRRVLLTTSLFLPVLAFPPNSATAASRLTIEEVESRLKRCFEDNEYYVSGNLDREIFDENCVFTDPTIRVKGTEKYAAAVASIFSPDTAHADLIRCRIVGPQTIKLDWRLEGTIRQGGLTFKFKPYTGTTLYTTDERTGLIVSQDEAWDISQLDVFVSLFLPSFGAPPAPPADVLRGQE